MGFISFLKSAEQKVANLLKGAAKAEPAAEAIADTIVVSLGHPEVVPFINKIGKLLTGAGATVTALQGATGTGPQKLALAAPMVDSLFRGSGFLSDKVIADEQKWSAAITGIASHFADLLNSVATKPPATPPPAA